MRISTAFRCVRAFTLVELLVATLIGGLVLTGVLTTNLQLVKSGLRVTQYAEMSAQARRAIEQLATDLRSASVITWNSARDITLTVPTAAGGTRQVTYAWTSATQAFYMVPGASSAATTGRVYLVSSIPTRPDGSAGVSFARYDVNGSAATTDLATKRVQVTLNLVRTRTTLVTSTDTMVLAIFVLRNKPAS